MSLDAFLRVSAKNYPDKVAVYYEDEAITYSQLDQEVDRIAQGLRDLSLRPNERVAVILGNCADFVKIYYAILRAGGCIVPLSMQNKEDEIRYILKDSEIRYLVTAAEFLPNIKKIRSELTELRTIAVGETEEEQIIPFNGLSDKAANTIHTSSDEDRIAACLYTSGTSGNPKGALLTHSNLEFLTRTCSERMRVGSDDKGLCVIPLSHIFSQLVNMLIPLYLGASFTILPQFTPQLVLDKIKEKKITYFAAVPAMYTALVSVLSQKQDADISSLRLCVSGGAPLPLEITEFFYDRYDIPVIEGSGPTEAVACLGVPEANKPGSVGPPFNGVEVKVVDDNDNTLPAGEVGEFCVRGPNMMQGYLNLPEETAYAIRGGWFHTGDLARIDEDGYVFIIGRKKDMILVAGLNVYPAEVEQCLNQHPKVAEAAVIGIPDKDRGEVPKAFIVLKQGMEAEPKEFILYCRKYLANYKCPREVALIDSLPRNAMGKVDKKLLNINQA